MKRELKIPTSQPETAKETLTSKINQSEERISEFKG